MTESDWLTSTDPQAMLDFSTHRVHNNTWHHKAISARKLRLFACACCRLVWDRLTDPRSRRAVEVAERYADGLATEAERHNARAAASFSAANLPMLAQATCYRNETLVRGLLDELAHEHGVSSAAQAALLRDLFNPWRNQGLAGDPAGARRGLPSTDGTTPAPRQPWLTPLALPLARAAYEERPPDGLLDSGSLGTLADALEEAGCTDAAPLAHLRGLELCPLCEGHVVVPPDRCECGTGWIPLRGPHARGCWAMDLDLVLGKE